MKTATAMMSKPLMPNQKRTSNPPNSDIFFDNWTPKILMFPLMRLEELAEEVLSALHTAELVARPSSTSFRTTLPLTIRTIAQLANKSTQFRKEKIKRSRYYESLLLSTHEDRT